MYICLCVSVYVNMYLGTDHYFLSGCYLSRKKKLFSSCSWLKKIVCFKVMKGKGLPAE